jgi:hypothetical protein
MRLLSLNKHFTRLRRGRRSLCFGGKLQEFYMTLIETRHQVWYTEKNANLPASERFSTELVWRQITMGKKSFLVLAASLVATMISSSCASAPQQYYDNGVSDEEYVSIAGNTPEAQAFVAKYPQAEVVVDRSGKLAVDFRMTKHPVTSTTQTWEGIRLRVFIDPKTNQPTETFLQCNNELVQEQVIQYLEQYAETESCP